MAGRVGNTQGMVAGASAHLQVRYGLHGALAYGQGDYSQVNGRTNISRSVLHLRYFHELARSMWWEAYVQQQTDKFRLLRARELAGTGPRFGIYQSPGLDLHLGTSYLLEYETIDVPAGASDSRSVTAHRWSTYVTVALLHEDRITATTTTYLQPRLDRPSDYRLLNETALTVDLTRRFATRLTLSTRMDSDPPTSVRRADLEIKNSLVMKF